MWYRAVVPVAVAEERKKHIRAARKNTGPGGDLGSGGDAHAPVNQSLNEWRNGVHGVADNAGVQTGGAGVNDVPAS